MVWKGRNIPFGKIRKGIRRGCLISKKGYGEGVCRLSSKGLERSWRMLYFVLPKTYSYNLTVYLTSNVASDALPLFSFPPVFSFSFVLFYFDLFFVFLLRTFLGAVISFLGF